MVGKLFLILSLFAIQGAFAMNPMESYGQELANAAHEGNEAEVQRLIRLGADVNWIDSSGVSVLDMALEASHLGVISILVEHNVKAGAHLVDTLLGVAANRGDAAGVKLFLGRGASVDARIKGYTPLILAARGHFDVVRVLLDY